ncbi:MAG: hypothetical protein ACE5KM_09300 [Planctomycetaceae bacterium]
MEPVLIPCPQCGKHLKLRDRSLLGRKGKCPACEYRFRLELPEEVELELADADTPAVGTGAQWVPDHPSAAGTAGPAIVPVVNADETSAVGTARLQAVKQRGKSQKKLAAIVGGVAAVIVGGVALWAASQGRKPTEKKKPTPGAFADIDRNDSKPGNAAINPQAPKAPPRGEPIQLRFIPHGARLIIHIRPAEIWNITHRPHDVLACLGARLGGWLNKKLEDVLRFEPEEVEEAVICLFLEDKTRPPEYAVAVKLKESKYSSFPEKFGKPLQDLGRKLYIRDPAGNDPGRVFMVTDERGREFASAPLDKKQEMVDAIEQPGLAAGGLDQLLKRTDDKRHLTIIFNLYDLGDYREHFFPESVHATLGHFLDRFDPQEIESVAWSFYFGGEPYPDFFSEMILRNKTTTSPRQLQVDMEERLKDLPGDLAGLIRLMRPRTVADRKLVSRLPVMFEAFRGETVATFGKENERYVKLTTALPRIAGPNLAAAGVLTWQLAQRTDFSKPPPIDTGNKLPERVADRLKLKVEAVFNGRPLSDAFNDIGEAISVRFEVNGDALMAAGHTKNIPQRFNLGMVPATRAIHEIIKENAGMVIVVVESEKKVIVTTEKVAKMKGQTIFDVTP